MADAPCWQPSTTRRAHSVMMRFLQTINQTQTLPKPLENYDELHAWSIAQRAEFWQAIADFFAIEFTRPAQSVLRGGLTDAQWFTGAHLNFAAHLLRAADQQIAIEFRNERGDQRRLTFHALRVAVAQCAAGLRRAGVQPGDRVAGLLPNIPETVIAMLATTALGAIWSACSPDFGTQAVIERYQQITPKVLFITDAAQYNGKPVTTLTQAQACLAQLPTLQIVLIPYIDPHAQVAWATPYADFIDSTAQSCEFVSVPFDHPTVILYSSGTTGAPKCITHGAGGMLLQHFKELSLHTDITDRDIVFYYSTCSWMMWNWLVSSLGLGATIVLYDGSPLHPHKNHLLDLIDELGITVFGASAKYYSTLEKAGLQPRQTHQLTTLKTLLSTGSPLLPEQYDYIYTSIKSDVCVASISGGTDLISCFALGCPLKPVYRGQLTCLGLGMDVAVYNEAGNAVQQSKGELVCRQAFPTMPLCFWNDPDKQLYTAAYFAKFPGVWAHGDFAEITAEGGLIVYGRSDATLKPAGVRVGTAEIYRVVEHFPEIVESVCVGYSRNGDEKIVLFVVMQNGCALTEELVQRIKSTLREQVSPHHVPQHIYAVSQLPRTISGKLVEVAIRNILQGQPITNKTALINPQVLTEFETIAKTLR